MMSNMWPILLHLHYFGAFIPNLKAKIVLFALVIPYEILVPLSRLYVGVHAGNQVFYGIQLGIFLALFLHY